MVSDVKAAGDHQTSADDPGLPSVDLSPTEDGYTSKDMREAFASGATTHVESHDPDQTAVPASPAIEEAGDGPALQQIASEVRSIVARIASIDETIGQRLKYDQTKERMFDRLHDELQLYRKDAFHQSKKRLLIALLLFYDSLLVSVENAAEEPKRALRDVLDDFLEVLYTEEVEPILTEVGEEFNPNEHRAVGRVMTEDGSQDRLIDEVVRPGFRWGDKILRPADVHVRRHQPIVLQHMGEARQQGRDAPPNGPSQGTPSRSEQPAERDGNP